MFKLICSNPVFLFATQATGSGRYIIKNGAYLIEAPPKRPVNSYALYIKDNTAGKKNYKVSSQSSSLGKKWEQYQEIRKKYTGLAKQKSEGYQERKSDYEKKYVVPFKSVSTQTLRLQKLFTSGQITGKGKGIEGIGGQVKKALQEQPRTIEQDDKLKAQAEKIKQERQAIKRSFLFPALLYPSIKSYLLKKSVPKQLRGPNYEKEMEEAYKVQVENWKESVKKWLADNKYDLTLQEFLALREKGLKEKKKAKAEKVDKDKPESSDDN